jgi:hypothetical protein
VDGALSAGRRPVDGPKAHWTEMRKRVARLLFLAVGLLLALYLARSWPKDQTVHYVLGDAAPRVQEVDARWASSSSASDTDLRSGEAGRQPEGHTEWLRQVTFHYAAGKAPRIVTHEPRLPDGDYTVELEIAATATQMGPSPTLARSTVRRHVTLGGGPLSIDLAEAVPR